MWLALGAAVPVAATVVFEYSYPPEGATYDAEGATYDAEGATYSAEEAAYGDAALAGTTDTTGREAAE